MNDRLLIEWNMKRLDDGKVSLVEFLRSIKFAQHKQAKETTECPTHFAHFNQRARDGGQRNSEDSQLIRSELIRPFIRLAPNT